MAKNVVLYTAEGCLFCEKVKAFLLQRGVPFTTRDIIEDEEAMKELERMNLFITPVTVIDGQPVVGFNAKELERLLQ